MSDYYGMDGEPITIDQWASLYETSDRIIGKTELVDGSWVSTVHLGLNHQFGEGPPLIFETMVFPPDDMLELDMERYSTKQQAIEGHERMVRKWSERTGP